MLIITITPLAADIISLIVNVEPGGFDSQHSNISIIFVYPVKITFLITWFNFSNTLIRIGDPEIRLKAFNNNCSF